MCKRSQITAVAACVVRLFVAASVGNVCSGSYAQNYVPQFPNVPETTRDYLPWCSGAGWFGKGPDGLSCALVIGNSAGLLATLGSGSACTRLKQQLGDMSKESLERFGASIGNQVFEWLRVNNSTLTNKVVADTAAAVSALSGCK
jgi:hypothetical protein